MQSKAKTVNTYIKELPEDRKAALIKLQKMCLDTLVGYEEVMDYGMPCYKKNGIGGIAFASQKNYISLYVGEDVVKKNKKLLQGLSVGKVCIRYPRPDKIDFEVVKQLLSDTVKSTGKVC